MVVECANERTRRAHPDVMMTVQHASTVPYSRALYFNGCVVFGQLCIWSCRATQCTRNWIRASASSWPRNQTERCNLALQEIQGSLVKSFGYQPQRERKGAYWTVGQLGASKHQGQASRWPWTHLVPQVFAVLDASRRKLCDPAQETSECECYRLSFFSRRARSLADDNDVMLGC